MSYIKTKTIEILETLDDVVYEVNNIKNDENLPREHKMFLTDVSSMIEDCILKVYELYEKKIKEDEDEEAEEETVVKKVTTTTTTADNSGGGEGKD